MIVCFVLILAVLLQSGKSADLAGAFGGGGSQTVFGPRGAATILTKVTTISAIMFMVTSFSFRIISSKGESSVVRGTEAQTEEVQGAATTPVKKDEEAKPPADKKEAADTQTDQTTEKKPPEKKVPEKK